MAEVEGFICPLCMEDLKGISQLEEHFKHEHEEKRFSKLKAVKSNLKNIIDKAKPKRMKKRDDQRPTAAIVAQDATSPLPVDPAAIISGIDPALWPPQEFGTAIDHILEFRKIRDSRLVREAMETNRLVVRVEKLFRLLRDGQSRKLKAIEKEMVPSRSDREEKSCTKCGKAFNLLQRRKYLCLLCGDAICDGCSLFVSLSEIYPLLKDCPDYPTLTRSYQQPKKFSLLGDENEDMRMCSTCRDHLSSRLQCMASEVKSLLTTHYKKMQLAIDEADSLRHAYLEVAESLMNGEYLHTLQEAQSKRGTLLQLYNSIDSISKQILSMGTTPPAASPECSQAPPPPENSRLCRAIRTRASQYLQENLVTLAALPSQEKLQNVRAAKEREAQERVREQQRKREDQRQQGAGADVTARSLPVGTKGTSDRDDVDGNWAGMMGSRDSPPKVDPFVE